MILDIVFAAIMIFSIVWGFKKGLVRSVCNVFSFILSVIVAFLLYSPITEFITASPLGVFISDKITGSVKMPQVDLSTVPTNRMIVHKSKVWNECVSINCNLNVAIYSICDIEIFCTLITWIEH